MLNSFLLFFGFYGVLLHSPVMSIEESKKDGAGEDLQLFPTSSSRGSVLLCQSMVMLAL